MQINWNMVGILIKKDLKLQQKAIAGYILCTFLSLVVLGYPHVYALVVGCILLLTAMVASGQHTAMVTTVTEQKEQTLPFILSLPVNPATFSIAKILANLSIFFSIWLVMVVSLTFVTLTTHVPDGFLPFFWLICIQMLVLYCVVLCIALVSQNEGWTIFAIVMANLSISPAIMLMSNSPDYYTYFEQNVIHWPQSATITTLVYISVAVAVLFGTLVSQTKRTTFI